MAIYLGVRCSAQGSGAPLPCADRCQLADHQRGWYSDLGCRPEDTRQSRCSPLSWEARYRGKSELHRAGCWLTASGGDSKDSATETYRPWRALPATSKGEMAREELTGSPVTGWPRENPSRARSDTESTTLATPAT